MYACTVKPGADFSRSCAGGTIDHSILKTRPPPIRESTLATLAAAKMNEANLSLASPRAECSR
jgi:hypothetical protein